MTQTNDQISLNLNQELEKEILTSQLTQLLESFKTDELSFETITEEVEQVRAEIYAKQISRVC